MKFKVNQFVWIKTLKKKGKIQSLNVKDKKAKVTYFVGKGQLQLADVTFKDLAEYRPKAPLSETTKKVLDELKAHGYVLVQRPIIKFARLREDAKIPSKKREDAGYDIYASFKENELVCPKGVTTFVPTGLCYAIVGTDGQMDVNWYLNLKHERGKTATVSMAILAGVSDSGYRDNVFIAITPLEKDIVISKSVSDVQRDVKYKYRDGDCILYPYEKAIAQATVDLVVDAVIQEDTVDNVKAVPSERGDGKVGSSGK